MEEFNVKLASIDPIGNVIKEKELSMMIETNKNSPTKDRLFIYIGECLYVIDSKGYIIEKLIPHEK
jgi:hypothetical protein